MRLIALSVLSLALAGSASAQTGVIDQANTANDNVGYNMGFYYDMQQVIPITTTGQMEGFKINIAADTFNKGIPVALFAGQGPFPASHQPLWSGIATPWYPGGYKETFVDLTLAGLFFNAGEYITIRIGDGVSPVAGTSLVANAALGGPYYGAGAFYEQGVAASFGEALWFETWFYGCAGSAVPYGLGCAGTGAIFPKLSMFGCPIEGNQVLLEVSQGLGGSTALLFFGLQQGNISVGGTCPLLVTPLFGPSIILPLAGGGPGAGAISLPGILPLGTQGASFTMQAWVIDPTPLPGAAASNGLQVTIG